MERANVTEIKYQHRLKQAIEKIDQLKEISHLIKAQAVQALQTVLDNCLKLQNTDRNIIKNREP